MRDPFLAFLPVKPFDVEDMSRRTAPIPESERQTEPLKHVLLVDDDAACLNGISRCLRLGGLQVVIASSGEEALAQLAARKPDLIISDVMMPGMSGYELCRRVRQHKGFDDIPFLFLSALGSPPERVVGLRMGADDYIVKPVDEQELILKVRKQLKKTDELRDLKRRVEEGDVSSRKK